MLGYIGLELRRTVRDGGYMVIAITLPVAMYLIFSSLGLIDEDGGLYMLVAMAAFGASGAAFNNGSGVAEDAAVGWLRQLRVTPLGPVQVVVSRAVVGMLVVLPAVVAVLTVGGLVKGVELAPWQWLSIGTLLWLGVAPIVLFALGNGFLLSGKAAPLANSVLNLALAIMGGLWLPISDFPGWMATLASWTPTNRYAELSWDIVLGGSPSAMAFVVLGGWLVIFCGYAVFGYRRARLS
ncbi:ABC transporter permease [Nonomuraea sp. NPDC050663]|uniref:ABC transporter permease n=1 Tax=Nonomuraea sp. NPDC050663 TaxID=3364370 RepID=UPI00379F0593